jgi:hypothetical protein
MSAAQAPSNAPSTELAIPWTRTKTLPPDGRTGQEEYGDHVEPFKTLPPLCGEAPTLQFAIDIARLETPPRKDEESATWATLLNE